MEKKRSTKTLLESFVYGGVLTIFAVLPLLYFPGMAGSYVTSKHYFLIGAVDILCVAWVWLLLADRRYRLTARNLVYMLPLSLFLGAQTISAFLGVNPANSFFSKVESGTGLIVLYHAFLLACMVASLLRVWRWTFLKRILQANLFASVVLASFIFFTGGHGYFQTNSPMLNGSTGGAMMGNVLLAGAYLIFSIFLTIVLIARERTVYKKALYYLGIAVMVLSPVYFNANIIKGTPWADLVASGDYFLGQARTATVALLIGGGISVLIWCALQRKKLVRIIGIAGIVCVMIIAGLAVRDIALPGTSLNTIFITGGGNRVVDWKAAVQGIQERPVWGWGNENFHVVYQKYLDPIVFSPERADEVWALHPHNNTLEVLVNGGVVSFMLYLLTLIVLLVGIMRLYKKGVFDSVTTALFIGMLAAFFMQQQMIYESIVSYTMLFFVIAIPAGLLANTSQARTPERMSAVSYLAVLGVAGIMIPTLLYAAVFPAGKFKELHQVALAHSDQRPLLYDRLFHSTGSYAINTDPEYYTDALFFSYDAQKISIKEHPVYRKVASEELASLVRNLYPIWLESPYNYHLSLSLLQIQNLRFYLTGDYALLGQADEYAQRAFALSPSDPQIYFAYAETLMHKGDMKGAEASLDKALALAPTYQPAIKFKKALNSH